MFYIRRSRCVIAATTHQPKPSNLQTSCWWFPLYESQREYFWTSPPAPCHILSLPSACPRFRTHFEEFIFLNYEKIVGWTVTVNISFISVSKVQVLHQQFFKALVLEILTTFHQQSPQCFTKMHGWGEKNRWKVQYPAVTKEPWHHLL